MVLNFYLNGLKKELAHNISSRTFFFNRYRVSLIPVLEMFMISVDKSSSRGEMVGCFSFNFLRKSKCRFLMCFCIDCEVVKLILPKINSITCRKFRKMKLMKLPVF